MAAIQMPKTKSRRSQPLTNIFFFLFLHGIACDSSGADHPPQKEAARDGGAALFIFGDSYLDAGNNNFINTSTLDQANFWPYGETFFHYPTGRFSDGRIIPDFIAEHAKLPSTPPFLRLKAQRNASNTIDHIRRSGVNFASGGAGALVETFQGSVIDLKTQLRNFDKMEGRLRVELGKRKAEGTLGRGVYLVCVGSNDYMSPFLTNSTILNSFPHPQYVGMVIANLTTLIKEIYRKGGRKFGFINLPPLGCLPGIRVMQLSNNGSNCLAEASSLAKSHNRALSRLLVKLEHQLKGFKYSLYDFNHFVTQRINNPSHYGFREGKGACCGTGKYRGVYSCGGKRIVKEYQLCDNPSSYLFWDSFHLTEKAYNQLADDMWSPKTQTDRFTLKDLFQAH